MATYLGAGPTITVRLPAAAPVAVRLPARPVLTVALPDPRQAIDVSTAARVTARARRTPAKPVAHRLRLVRLPPARAQPPRYGTLRHDRRHPQADTQTDTVGARNG